MFGRTVKIDGREVFVFCSPNDRLSEVLARAARQLAREEAEEAAIRARPYRDAINRLRSAST